VGKGGDLCGLSSGSLPVWCKEMERGNTLHLEVLALPGDSLEFSFADFP
jgi:hypothetical protein